MHIEIRLADGTRSRVELTELPAYLGRDPSCDVAVASAQVSRKHATLVREGDAVTIVDLGSTNGVRINGVRTPRAALREGDEIVLGDVTLRVASLELPAAAPRTPSPRTPSPPSPAPARAPVSVPATLATVSPATVARAPSPSPDGPATARRLAGHRRRVLVASLGPALVVLVAGLWLGHWLLTDTGGSPAAPSGGVAERIRGEVAELRVLIAMMPRVTPEIVERVAALRERYGDAFRGGVHPVDDLLAELRSRRELELHNRFFAYDESRRELLDARRFGEVLALVEAMRIDFQGERIVVRDRIDAFEKQTREAVQRAYEAWEGEVSYLELPEYHDDCLALYENALEMFAGSEYVARIQTRREEFLERTREAIERRKRLIAQLAARLEANRARETPAPEAREIPVAGLSGLLAEPIRAGALRSRTYELEDGLRGKPVGMRDEVTVLIATTAGEEIAVPFDRIPRATQLRMASDCLKGDALLAAAAHGFRWELPREAGQLLHLFVAESGADRKARETRAFDLLATARGAARVPDGGYSYHKEHGWEDARQRVDREAFDKAVRVARRLGATLTTKSLRENFEKAAAYVDDKELSPSTRSGIRKEIIAALETTSGKLVIDVQKHVQRAGFIQLRAVKRELNRRRAEALRLIFDTAVYLPENHPDYPKGDRVNGQAEVDRVVGDVREMWENAAQYALRLDPAARKRIERLRMIREEFYPRLRHRLAAEDEAALEDLWNNLDEAIDLRSFCLDRDERRRYEYDRKVERYNRELQPENGDLPEQDRVHVIVVNDYREMLGLKRLFIDIRLCRATRKHSEACNAAGRIWHDGPDGSPGSRAKAEGFPAGVAENVAIGYANGPDIWTRGWYRASDHHRNALGAGWTCIGYGYAGSVGTQNFAVIGAPF